MSSPHGNQKVSDEEIISVIKEIEEPVVSASEVASRLGITRTSANMRMKRLRQKGMLSRKNVGNGYVWWLNTQPDDAI
ncbi:winged helix-turn-helix transcriptional regulator [Halobellus sp. Atlit-38R]|uniref:winged helix-turn-helix transcriptional regulator n=1 Tax=Halobellus sp. Atlit-38R TaxID=2282131 RepID=UPI000EF230EF|nr:winged helix-turn-helix transcriptional regulator [Halobellus sp. Atlit-38R]